MKLQTNFNSYYSNIIPFSNRLRMHNTSRTRPYLIHGKNNQNISIYIYKDSNNNIDINERTYDSFTGLRDKQYLFAVLNKAISDNSENKKDISLAMFDMDNFKSVNELLGYETGDDFIRFVSGGIDSVAKEYSIHAYRFGGEEFVLIFNDENKDKQKEIVDKILQKVNSNSYIRSKEDEYRKNAEERLIEYSFTTEKINFLMQLKAKKKIYKDLQENLSTLQARQDSYLLDSIKETDNELNSMYLHLISDAVSSEQDKSKLEMLEKMRMVYENNMPVNESEEKLLDEYLKYRYDKSAELFQTKKWLSDFKDNNGFSITGSVVTFKPEFYAKKHPMDLVNIAGEALKRGKHSQKGKTYI